MKFSTKLFVNDNSMKFQMKEAPLEPVNLVGKWLSQKRKLQK